MSKFGVREICDVVLKAKAAQKIGNKIFYKNEPVIYFDTLKTSSMEGAATTVYAQGGRGNPRLVSWDGERTVTFTMEDALISPEGFSILSGAGLVEASKDATIKQHVTETIDADSKDIVKGENGLEITLNKKPYFEDTSKNNATKEDYAYVMFMKNGEIVSEPYIPSLKANNTIVVAPTITAEKRLKSYNDGNNDEFPAYDAILVDYYTEHASGAQQIEIAADKFGGAFYLEASTLFRTQSGVDMPAEFIIPNCRIQSNFTFSMSNTGDPSTFTFTMDAFPDYTRFDHSKKVLACIQMITAADEAVDLVRRETWANQNVDGDGNPVAVYVDADDIVRDVRDIKVQEQEEQRP